MILGLVNSETYESYREKDWRRSIQYRFPNGKFPITGLLSLTDPDESVDPEYYHWEYRMEQPRTLTASQGTSLGPIKTAADANAGDPISLVADTEYIICVDVAAKFRVGNVIKLSLLNSSGATVDAYFRVTELTNTTSSPNKIKGLAIEAVPNLVNGSTNENVGREVLDIGNVFHEGRSSVEGEATEHPTKITNYTQIFRTPFSLTRTSLKNPSYYDKTGPYKHKSIQHSFKHMVELEMSVLFGRKREIAPSGSIDTTTGSGLPLRYTGGIIHHMEQWEAANSPYRGGTGAPALTSDTDDLKRIISNSSGNLSERNLDDYYERLSRYANDVTPEWMVVCGSTALKVFNQVVRDKTTLNANIPVQEAYGMKVTEHRSVHGSFYYKTHPLFNENPVMRNWMLFVDVRSLKLRPLKDSNTQLLKMRQPNDADYRKDEWMTEAGLEMWFPERFMLIKNVQTAIS